MKAIKFLAGVAVGYVLGARAGRGSYEKLKNRAHDIWASPTVQDNVSKTAETVKETVKDKAPEVGSRLDDAMKNASGQAGTGHRDHDATAAATGRHGQGASDG